MAHILLGGEIRSGAAIRSLLEKWGMTCGQWSGIETGGHYPTINECDALILVHPIAGDLSPVPGGPSVAPPAPLLLLGDNPGPVLLARDAWREVKDPGLDGVDLKPALQSCLDQSRLLRGQNELPFNCGNQEGYLQFLGHELRSPLTAAKTALEVLQGELGGLLDQDAGPEREKEGSQLKMLDIALRNIKRLHLTVDWSQDLLELEASALRGPWTRIPVEKLAKVVGGFEDLLIEEDMVGKCLETDPDLMRVLVGQLTKVLDYARPGCPLAVRARREESGDRGLELSIFPAEGCQVPNVPRINRTHLTPALGAEDLRPEEELERLMGFVVSKALLDHLQVRAWVGSNPEGISGLLLSIPLAEKLPADNPGSEDPPAVLRQPA